MTQALETGRSDVEMSHQEFLKAPYPQTQEQYQRFPTKYEYRDANE